MATTFVVRVQSAADEVCGVVERPGEEPLPFRDIAGLLALLGITHDALAHDGVGNGSGSRPSSDMREA